MFLDPGCLCRPVVFPDSRRRCPSSAWRPRYCSDLGAVVFDALQSGKCGRGDAALKASRSAKSADRRLAAPGPAEPPTRALGACECFRESSSVCSIVPGGNVLGPARYLDRYQGIA